MKSSSIYLIMIILLVLGGVVFVKCDSSGAKPVQTHADSATSPMGPAPDNNSANNPSSADTNYAGNGKSMTDTMRRDTLKTK